MGFFSGIGKAFKKIFSGVKKVFKAVTNAVKKVWKSSIGKALLIGAAVYLGGAALGAWSSPFQSINGALASTTGEAAAANVVGGAATGGVEVAAAAAPGAVTNTLGAAGGAGAAEAASVAGLTEAAAAGTTLNAAATSPIANAVGQSAVGSLATPTAQAALSPVAAAGTQSAAAPSLLETIKGAASKTINWFGEHPTATLLAGQTLASAMQPSEADTYGEILEKQQENSTIAGVKYDGSGPGIDLSRLAPNPNPPRRTQQAGPMSRIYAKQGRMF